MLYWVAATDISRRWQGRLSILLHAINKIYLCIFQAVVVYKNQRYPHYLMMQVSMWSANSLSIFAAFLYTAS